VVAHENIRGSFINLLKTGHFKTHSQNAQSEAYRSVPYQTDRLRPPQEKTKNNNRNVKNRDNYVDDAKDNRTHDSLQRLYHIFFRKRNECSLARKTELSLKMCPEFERKRKQWNRKGKRINTGYFVLAQA
jgi:hypothetical protein